MPTAKLSLTIAIFTLVSLSAIANEHGAKPEEGAKEGEAAAPVIDKEGIEYNKKEARLNTLRSRIEETNKKFSELIEAKNHSKDEKVKQEIAEEMIGVAKERNEAVKEFTALKQEVEYQHPNKGKEIDKKLLLQGDRKSNADAERSSGLDAKLSATKKLIDKKYAPLIPKEDKVAEAAQKQEKAKADTPKKLRLVK